MVSIYILRLCQNKFYVGRSDDVMTRIQSHFNGIGCEWTMMYMPIEIIAIIPNSSVFDEDKITLEYMNNYGINNVRGGSFVMRDLSPIDKYMINKMIKSANRQCFNCGSLSHYVKDCCEPMKIGKRVGYYEEGSNGSTCDSSEYEQSYDVLCSRMTNSISESRTDDYMDIPVRKQQNYDVHTAQQDLFNRFIKPMKQTKDTNNNVKNVQRTDDHNITTNNQSVTNIFETIKGKYKHIGYKADCDTYIFPRETFECIEKYGFLVDVCMNTPTMYAGCIPVWEIVYTTDDFEAFIKSVMRCENVIKKTPRCTQVIIIPTNHNHINDDEYNKMLRDCGVNVDTYQSM